MTEAETIPLFMSELLSLIMLFVDRYSIELVNCAQIFVTCNMQNSVIGFFLHSANDFIRL